MVPLKRILSHPDLHRPPTWRAVLAYGVNGLLLAAVLIPFYTSSMSMGVRF